jgi:Essential protein Yae1, N terminal
MPKRKAAEMESQASANEPLRESFDSGPSEPARRQAAAASPSELESFSDWVRSCDFGGDLDPDALLSSSDTNPAPIEETAGALQEPSQEGQEENFSTGPVSIGSVDQQIGGPGVIIPQYTTGLEGIAITPQSATGSSSAAPKRAKSKAPAVVDGLPEIPSPLPLVNNITPPNPADPANPIPTGINRESLVGALQEARTAIPAGIQEAPAWPTGGHPPQPQAIFPYWPPLPPQQQQQFLPFHPYLYPQMPLPQQPVPPMTIMAPYQPFLQEEFLSDYARMNREQHNAGYLEGITQARHETSQTGFDFGYPPGMHCGRRAGRVLGVLEFATAGSPDEAHRELYNRAKGELEVDNLLADLASEREEDRRSSLESTGGFQGAEDGFGYENGGWDVNMNPIPHLDPSPSLDPNTAMGMGLGTGLGMNMGMDVRTGNYIPPPSTAGEYITSAPNSGEYILPPLPTAGDYILPPLSAAEDYIPPLSAAGDYILPPLSAAEDYIPPLSAAGDNIPPPQSATGGYISLPSTTGGYFPPPSTSGDNNPPPQSATGGYISLPSTAGGYIPPPSTAGGYIPPLSTAGDYIPLPPSTLGGYTPQPVPPFHPTATPTAAPNSITMPPPPAPASTVAAPLPALPFRTPLPTYPPRHPQTQLQLQPQLPPSPTRRIRFGPPRNFRFFPDAGPAPSNKGQDLPPLRVEEALWKWEAFVDRWLRAKWEREQAFFMGGMPGPSGSGELNIGPSGSGLQG